MPAFHHAAVLDGGRSWYVPKDVDDALHHHTVVQGVR